MHKDVVQFFDTTVYGPAEPVPFIAKFDVTGNLHWFRSHSGIPGNFYEEHHIAISPNGNAYWALDTVIYKVDNLGNVNSLIPIGTDHSWLAAGIMSITTDHDENIYATSFVATRLTKISTDGEFIWVKRIAPHYPPPVGKYGYFSHVIYGKDSAIYIAGSFDPIEKGGGLYLNDTVLDVLKGEHNMYLVKMDLDSNVVWATRFGSNKIDNVFDLQVRNGMAVVFGEANGNDTVVFEATNLEFDLTNSSGKRGVLAAFDTDGTFVWAENLFSTLSFQNNCAIDDNMNSYIIRGPKIRKYSASGLEGWNNQTGKHGFGYLELVNAENFIVSTRFSPRADSGKVFRFSCDSTLATSRPSAHESSNRLQAFPNPNNGRFTLNYSTELPGTASLELTDLRGAVVWREEKEIAYGSNRLEIEALLSSGVYLLQILHKGSRVTTKIVVE